MAVVQLETVQACVRELRRGSLVAYPTETSYALGANPNSAVALDALFQIKKRSKDMPLSLITYSIAAAERFVRFSLAAKKIAEEHWPGPVTLVLPAKHPRFARQLGSRDGTIGIRVSSSTVAQAMARGVGGAVVATSANVSGAGDSYSPRDIERFFAASDSLLFLFNVGRLPRRLPSTILRVVGNEVIQLRAGATKIKTGIVRI